MTMAQTEARLSDAFPLAPPAHFFDVPPDFTGDTDDTLITEGPDAGRYYALVAPDDVCILDGDTECWTAPPSPTGYLGAMQGTTHTAEGQVIRTAIIAADRNHASKLLNFQGAVDSYANTGVGLLRVKYHDVPDIGVVATGAAWPGISDFDIAKIRASGLSGDWRWRPELRAYDMTGSQLVNTKGFTRLPSVRAYAASLGEPPVIIGGAAIAEEESMETATAPACSCQHALTVTAPSTANGSASMTYCASCGKPHTAAPVPPTPQAPPAVPVTPSSGGPSREEFDALAARVEQLEQESLNSDLADLEGMGPGFAAALGQATETVVATLGPTPVLPPEPITAAKPAADLNTEERQNLADKNQAMDDGSYPIRQRTDLGKAIQSIGRAKNADAVKAHIIKRAKELKATDELPADWPGSTKKK